MKNLTNQRKVIITLLFLCGVINYLDRSALSISAGHIAKEFSLSTEQLGIVFSAFSVGYALFNIVGGFAADKFGPKNTLLIAVIVWSLFSGALIFAVGFISILLIRICFGMAEGPLSTTTNKTIDLWYPDDKKTSMMGIASSGTPLGAAISGPVVGYIVVNQGWRVSFIIITIIGLIWALFWYKLVSVKPAKSSTEATRKERKFSTKIRIPLKKSFYLKKPTVISASLGFFAYNYILFFFLTWFPSYLERGLHFTLEKVSLLNIIPWTFGFVGIAIGGIIVDRFSRAAKGKDPLFPKRMVVGIGLLISGLSVFSVVVIHNYALIVTMVAISVFALYFTGSVYWGVLDDTVDEQSVGSIGGVMHAVGNVAGIVGPTITGFLVQITASFLPAFGVAGVIGIIGAVSAFIGIKRIQVTPNDIKRYAADTYTMADVFLTENDAQDNQHI